MHILSCVPSFTKQSDKLNAFQLALKSGGLTSKLQQSADVASLQPPRSILPLIPSGGGFTFPGTVGCVGEYSISLVRRVNPYMYLINFLCITGTFIL